MDCCNIHRIDPLGMRGNDQHSPIHEDYSGRNQRYVIKELGEPNRVVRNEQLPNGSSWIVWEYDMNDGWDSFWVAMRDNTVVKCGDPTTAFRRDQDLIIEHRER